jgi:hypothetical protein
LDEAHSLVSSIISLQQSGQLKEALKKQKELQNLILHITTESKISIHDATTLAELSFTSGGTMHDVDEAFQSSSERATKAIKDNEVT